MTGVPARHVRDLSGVRTCACSWTCSFAFLIYVFHIYSIYMPRWVWLSLNQTWILTARPCTPWQQYAVRWFSLDQATFCSWISDSKLSSVCMHANTSSFRPHRPNDAALAVCLRKRFKISDVRRRPTPSQETASLQVSLQRHFEGSQQVCIQHASAKMTAKLSKMCSSFTSKMSS